MSVKLIDFVLPFSWSSNCSSFSCSSLKKICSLSSEEKVSKKNRDFKIDLKKMSRLPQNVRIVVAGEGKTHTHDTLF